MFTSRIRRLVLAAALAVMPAQGVAAVFSVLLCHGDAQVHAMHVNDEQGHGSHHDGRNDDGGTAGNSSFHLCCNLTASAPPFVTLPAVLPDFPVRTFAPDPLHDLFFPDQPQRPPLA